MANDGDVEQISFPFVVFGTILLWVSWLFFNGGSTGGMFNARANNAPKIMMVTILAASSGALVAAFLKPIVMRTYSKKIATTLALFQMVFSPASSPSQVFATAASLGQPLSSASLEASSTPLLAS